MVGSGRIGIFLYFFIFCGRLRLHVLVVCGSLKYDVEECGMVVVRFSWLWYVVAGCGTL